MLPSFQRYPTASRALDPPQPQGTSFLAMASCFQLWSGLTKGSYRVVDSSTDAEQVILRIQRRTEREATGAYATAVSAFETALLGAQQKCVASDLALSRGTTSAKLRAVAETMGFTCCFTRLPLAVPLFLHVLNRPELMSLELNGNPDASLECVVRIRRFDDVLAPELSQSEYDVARRLLEGQSHKQMAAERRSSPRTIANQLSSVFRKTRSSGRFELLRATVERARALRVGARPGLAKMTTRLCWTRSLEIGYPSPIAHLLPIGDSAHVYT